MSPFCLYGRALGELDIELIRAHSPQAKGRVERHFGTAQDRWVKELRLARVRTIAQANALLEPGAGVQPSVHPAGPATE